MKFKLSKVKWFAALISLLSSVMSFSIGFGLWSIQGVDTDEVSGNIQVETVNDGTSSEYACFEDVVVNPFRYNPANGFVDEDAGVYSLSYTLTGTASLNVSKAKDSITSMSTKKLSALIEFNISVSNFSATNPTIDSGLTNTPIAQTLSGNTSTSASLLNITLSDAEYALNKITNIGFSTTVTFGGTAANFPSLSSATISFTLTAGEFVS